MFVGCSGGSLYASAIAPGMDSQTLQTQTIDLFKHDIVDGCTSNLLILVPSLACLRSSA